MRITVYGLWHLGSVTAGCLARAGHLVRGLDPDGEVVSGLLAGRPPVHEPGLAELISAGLASGRLSFTTDPADALAGADVLWVTFDTPVDDSDEADTGFIRQRLEDIADLIATNTLVLISSQVPAGFTRALKRGWQGRGVRFAVSPENLRLGKAIETFRDQERVIVGLGDPSDQELLEALLSPFCRRVEWMSVESAEMTKHALNAFLATSVAFINELARLCEAVGADAREVERGLKSEPRIGPRAYLAPGAAFAGGTLARDVRYLLAHAQAHAVETPLLRGVLAGNDAHKGWVREKVRRLVEGVDRPVVAVLGLTYKAGTSTLRRSPSVEDCAWLCARGVRVRAHDPAVGEAPAELAAKLTLCPRPEDALAGADVAVVATGWPEYRALGPESFLRAMRRANIVDPAHFLSEALAADPRIVYVATGRKAP
jgi:UDPglucose 6-dehydrogenase